MRGDACCRIAVHLLSCGGCQRCDALRVRSRIFEVLRFGTPIRANQESRKSRKGNRVKPPPVAPALNPNLTLAPFEKSRIRIKIGSGVFVARVPVCPARSSPAFALSPISRQLLVAPGGFAARESVAAKPIFRVTTDSAESKVSGSNSR